VKNTGIFGDLNIFSLKKMKIALPNSHTTSPVVTGSSVIALQFKGGIVMATDTMCSYYGMCEFK
jgi:20S proteasome alpha/beta subunit